MQGDDRRILLLSRLAVTLAVLLIASGLLFIENTDVKSNIASSLLGALLGYWFSTDSSEGAKHIQNGGVTQVNASIQDTIGASERAADGHSSDEK